MTQSTYPSNNTSSFRVEAEEGKEVNCHGCVKDVDETGAVWDLKATKNLHLTSNK